MDYVCSLRHVVVDVRTCCSTYPRDNALGSGLTMLRHVALSQSVSLVLVKHRYAR